MKIYKWASIHLIYGQIGQIGSEVNKPSEILIKTLYAVQYIESDIQNNDAPRIDDPII